jgi:hypothetical protein
MPEQEVETTEMQGQETQVEEQQEQESEVHESIETELTGEPLDGIFPLDPLVETVEKEQATTAKEEEKGEKKVEVKEPVTTADSLDTEKEPIQQQKQEVSNNEVAGLQAALLAERRKRQELEQSLSQQSQEKKEFNWDNPQETIENIKTDLRQEFQTNFLSMSESQAKIRHKDYDEKYQVFVSMAQENPAHVNAMLQQADPAEYAYQLAKQKMFTDEVGSDPAGYEEKLRAKIRAELETEFNQKIEDKLSLASNLPPSAAKLTDKVQQKVVSNDDPLGSVFKDVPS